MAIATDEAGIQFRILNSSKGPAVRATRAQADRLLYKRAIRSRLEIQPTDPVPAGGRRPAARRRPGGGCRDRPGRALLRARRGADTGTFLSGLIHVGLSNHRAGRAGDPPSLSLAARLAS